MSQVQTGIDPQLQQEPPAAARTSPALWLLLLLAVALAAWWLVLQRPAAIDASPQPTPATTALPAPIDETVAAAPAKKPAAKAKDATASKRVAPRSSAPSLIASSQVMPKYPASALRAGETGTVTVSALIDTSGVPIEVVIDDRSGNREMDRAAIAAVKQWRFEPATRNGKPVQQTVRVPVEFALNQG